VPTRAPPSSAASPNTRRPAIGAPRPDALRAYAQHEVSQHKPDRALDLYARSLTLYTAVGGVRPAAEVGTAMGDLLMRRRRPAAARLRYAQAEAMYSDLGAPTARLTALRKLARAERGVGNLDGARAAYLQALVLSQVLADSDSEVELLVRLGDVDRDAHLPTAPASPTRRR
jgi:tetratricopeptide (TPR) repeat protein